MDVVETAIRELARIPQNDPVVAGIVTAGIVITIGIFLWFQSQTIQHALSQINILIKGSTMLVYIIATFYISAVIIGTEIVFVVGAFAALIAYRAGFYWISVQWEALKSPNGV